MASSTCSLVLCSTLLVACDGGQRASDDAPAADAGVDAPVYEATEIDLDLGHVTMIRSLQRAGGRALSTDMTGHWVLWDIAGHQAIARGDACAGCPTFLSGDTVATRVTGRLEVRSATTGSVSATIPTDASNVGVSSDGAYVWAATATHLRAWSAAGTLLLEVERDYRTSRVFASPTELRIAPGPAGTNMIEAIRVSDGVTTSFGFAGTFHSWFEDGERFLTATGAVVRVYTKDGMQLALAALPTVESLTGQGTNVWTFNPVDRNLRIYAAGNLDSPIQTYALSFMPKLFPAGPQIGVYEDTGDTQILTIISLGPSVTRSGPIPVPIHYLSAFGGDSSGWLVGNGAGVVFDGAAVLGTSVDRRALSYGRAWSMAGADDGTAVIATASGRSPVLALGGTTTVVSHELAFRSTHVELSQDATLLVGTDDLGSAQYHEDRSLRVVTVADGAEVYTWPYHWSDYPDLFFDFSFARQGLVLCHMKARFNSTSWIGERVFTDVTGTTLPTYGSQPFPTNSGAFNLATQLPRFSPDGTHAAFRTASSLVGSTAQLYSNGVLVGAVEGVPVVWIDNDHLLVTTYRHDSGKGGISTVQDKVFIYDPTGTQRTPAMLPPASEPYTPGLELLPDPLAPVGGSLVYSRRHNAVFDYTTGARTWQGDPAVKDGTIVGSNVLFTKGHRVFRAAFQ